MGLTLAAALSLPAMAQYGGPQGAPPQGGPMGGHRGGPGMHANVDERVKMLTERLNLTPEQQTKVRTIMEDQQKEMTALRENTSMTEQERRSKMQEIHRNGMEQVRSILTPEQQQKMQQMHQNMEHRGEHENGPPPAPPSN